MATSYSKFKYQDIEDLGVNVIRKKLFETLPPAIQPSDFLNKTLEMNLKRHLGTEKAKSEQIITPVLNELVERNINELTFFSGYNFDVDKSQGLKGHVDFILTKDAFSPIIKAPIFCVVEAKNDNLDVGGPQCIAEMFASKIFNEQKKHPISKIYGTVTFGLAWQFLCLENNTCIIDTDVYYLNDLPKLLGIIQYIIDEK
ncbi:MAG: hypothetical protein U5M51_00630 [Emticicia sp.]|nr:hypothetical protein [Emticicia sp.]